MKTFEIKGFWGFVLFAIVAIVAVSLAVAVPITMTWVSWNALVFELFQGPEIAFWQAALLTTIIAVSLKIIFQPQISFQVKRVKSPEDLNKNLYLNKPDSTNE